MYSVIALIVVSLVLRFIFHTIKVNKSELSVLIWKLPPCFKEYPFIGSALHFLRNSDEDLMDFFIEYSKEVSNKGGTCRGIGLNFFYVITTDPADAAKILKECLEKDPTYRFLRVITGNGSVFANVREWKVRRKILVPIFNTKMMAKSVDIFYDNSQRLSRVLDAFVGAGPFSVLHHIAAYSFNSISDITFGVNRSLKGDSDAFFESLKTIFDLLTERMSHIWMHPDFVYKLLPQSAELEKCNQKFIKCVDEAVNNRKRELQESIKDKSEYIIDFLLESALDEEGIREECKVILAAMDTSTITLGYILKMFSLYPQIQDKVYEEIRNVFHNSGRATDKDDLLKLSYLDRVIKETMRLFPPAPVVVRRATKKFTLPSGYVIPADAGAGVSIIGVHRNPKYWGSDVEHFDPDRFLPERFEKIDPNAFIPFSTGPRNCIGYRYGLVSIKMAISTILRKYKIVEEPADGPIPNIKSKFGVLMTAVDGFQISLEKRH